MKFKSKALSSRVVERSSGMPCLLFETKDRGGKIDDPSNTLAGDQSLE